MIQYSSCKGNIDIHCLGLAFTPPGAISAGVLSNPDSLAIILQSMRKEYRWKGNNVSLTLGAQAYYTKPIHVPPMKAKELTRALKWEVEKYFPLQASETIHDYYQLDYINKPINDNINILLTAVKKETVKTYLSVLSAVGLKPAALEIAPLTLMRSARSSKAIRFLNKNTVQVLLDIGYSYSTLVLMKNSDYCYSRILKFGITDFFSSIFQGKQFTPEMIGTAAELAGQIKESLVYGLNQGGTVIGKPETIWLCGGGSYIPGLANYLQNSLSLIIKPLHRTIESGRFSENLFTDHKKHAPLFSMARGLALRGWF